MAVTSSGDGNFSSVIAGGLSVNDDVIIDHDVTLDGDAPNVNSLTINPSKTFTGGGNTVTIDDKDGSAYSFRARNGSTISGTLNIKVTGNGGYIRDSATGSINNLEVDLGSSSEVHYLDTALSLAGNLTITEGIFNTNASSNHALTVAGGIKNTGTLTANASTIIITGEIAGFAFDQMGTFNAGTSTIQIGDGSTSTVGSSTHFKSNNCHNLIINQHIDAPNGNVAWRAYTGTELTIGGNLTITRGRFYRNTSTQDLTVTGDVDIASVGKLGTEAASGSNTFGSLTINSGGTYQATSGTTTITSETSGGFAIDNNGTFTHNNGTVTFTFAGTTKISLVGNSLYNVIVNDSSAAVEYIGDTTIDNDLTVTAGKFRYNNFDDLTVTGDVSVTGILGHPNVATTSDSTFGSLTINSGGEYLAPSGTTIMKGALRNVGGTIS